jgi:hypothetical protein
MRAFVLCCVACGSEAAPPAASPSNVEAAPASAALGDDAKRKQVLEVAGKVDAIRTAAAARDWDALRGHMCEDFDFGGAARGREGAIASWRADPNRMDALVRTIEGDCTLDEAAGVRWTCRPRAGSPDAQPELVSLTHDAVGRSWCVFAKAGQSGD